MGGTDVMCIKSGFLRGLIGRIISKKLKQKGYDLDIIIDELNIESNGNRYIYVIKAKGSIGRDTIDKVMDEL